MLEVFDTWIVWVSGVWMQCLRHWNMMNDSGFFFLFWSMMAVLLRIKYTRIVMEE